MMSQPTFLLPLLLSLSLPGPATGWDTEPHAARSQGADIEQEAIDLKAAGKYREAFRKIEAALDGALREAETDPEALARAEFLAHVADNLATKIPDHEGLVKLMRDLRKRPVVVRDHVLRARLDHFLAEHLLASGRGAEAADVMEGLGYVRDFQVLGPLDNERGAGFRREFAPEKAPGEPLDLAAVAEGKKRPVAWRRVQLVDVPLRTLDLGARMRPNEEALAYAAFCVSSEVARDACLRIASTGSLVVRVNGEVVLRRDVQQRPLGADQDACTFRLLPGANLVCVKICAQQGSFQARMRLTAPDGGSLPSRVTVDADPLRVTEAGRRTVSATAPAGDGQVPPPKLGAVTWLERQMRRLEEGPPAPDSEEARRLGMLAYRLAYILALRAEDDDASRRDLNWAKIAADLLPDYGAAHYLLAFTLIKRGGSVADRDDNARLAAYLAAVRAWPRFAEAMRALATLERESRGNLAKAEDWVQKALAIHPQFVFACHERIELYGARDFDAAKTKATLDYLADPQVGGHPAILARAIDLYERRDDVTKLLALQQRLVDLDYGGRNLTNLARLEMRAGRSEDALKTARRAVTDFPQQRGGYELLAGLHGALGDTGAATRVWNEWLELCPEDEQTWLELAELAAREGKSDLLVSHLERALALNPNLKEVRRRLDYLKADTKSFYSGFEIDAQQALAADTGPDPDAKEKGDSHYYVFRHDVIRAYRDGTASRYEHFLVRVLNEEGVNQFDTYMPTFNRSDQSARILEARVIRPDGKEARARLGRGIYVDLPPIKVGDAVEIAARVDDRARSFFGDYFGLVYAFPAGEPVPVRRARLDLILEPGRRYHFQQVGDVPEPAIRTLADGAEHRGYEMRGLPRRETEERAPSLAETGPLVRVSTYGTWDEFASWWWNLIRKQTVPTPEIRAKVAELVKGAQTIEEKVRRIYDFIVTDIRYKAWEFGVHGYKPYSVGAIFSRRHGDCKDKAILMNAMLAEIGVEAFPVLIRAETSRERDDLALPMVEHFNHCISYIPAQHGMPERFVDGTAQYHPIDTLPSMDRGADVLTVHGEQGRIATIPWTDALSNRDELRYHVQLEKSGDAVIELVHRPHMNFAPAIRDRYGNQPGRRHELLSDRLGRVFGKVEILDTQFSDLLDLGSPVAYTVKLRVKDFAAKDGSRMRLKTAFEPDKLSRLTAGARRVYDMLLGTPASRDVTIVYEAPPGWAWGALPEPVELNTEAGSFTFRVERDGSKLTIQRRRTFQSQRIDVDDYAAFKRLAETVDAAEALEIDLEPRRNGSK